MEAEDGRALLIQTDWDCPGIASTFGWSVSKLPGTSLFPECSHNGTDGTIKCPDCGLAASAFIESAREWIEDNDGTSVKDPGYFD